jgi:hypothetical protein
VIYLTRIGVAGDLPMLADLINCQLQLPFAAYWGGGGTSTPIKRLTTEPE